MCLFKLLKLFYAPCFMFTLYYIVSLPWTRIRACTSQNIIVDGCIIFFYIFVSKRRYHNFWLCYEDTSLFTVPLYVHALMKKQYIHFKFLFIVWSSFSYTISDLCRSSSVHFPFIWFVRQREWTCGYFILRLFNICNDFLSYV